MYFSFEVRERFRNLFLIRCMYKGESPFSVLFVPVDMCNIIAKAEEGYKNFMAL